MKKIIISTTLFICFILLSFNLMPYVKNFNRSRKEKLWDFKMKSNNDPKIFINGNDGFKALNLTGNGTSSYPYIIENKIIDSGGTGSCLRIQNTDVFFIIQNCTLIDSGSAQGDDGMRLENVTNGIISKNRANNHHTGIYLFDVINLTLFSNIVYEDSTGISIQYSDYIKLINNSCHDNNQIGIDIGLSNNCTLINNSLSSNTDGTYLVSSHNNTFNENLVSGNGWGIILFDSRQNLLFNNTVTSNGGGGIILDSSNNNTLLNNTVSLNYWFGVKIKNSNNNSLLHNIVNKNDYHGFYLETSNYNRVCNNTVGENGEKGIYLQSNSDYNTIQWNYLIYNKQGIFEDSTCNGNIIINNVIRDRFDFTITIWIVFILSIILIIFGLFFFDKHISNRALKFKTHKRIDLKTNLKIPLSQVQ